MMSHFIFDVEFQQCWRKVGILTLLWVCILSVSIRVDAQTERELPRMSAHRTSEEIKVDGVLDEPVWQSVEPIRQLYQIQPDQGDPATEQSEVRILYDDKKLYFGFIFLMRWTRLSRTTCAGTPQACVPTITVFCCWIPTMTGGTPFSSDSPRWVGWKTLRFPTAVGVSIQVGILFGNAVVESMKTIGQWKSQFRSVNSVLNKAR